MRARFSAPFGTFFRFSMRLIPPPDPEHRHGPMRDVVPLA